jgi:polar amino acid transport system substrate-binding protein
MSRSPHPHRIRGALIALAVMPMAAFAVAGCGSNHDSSSAAAPAAATTKAAANVAAPGNLIHGGTITLGTDFTFPPYENIDGSKQTGFDVEVAALIGQELGLKVKQVDTRFSALIPSLDAGKFDAILSALYITPERAKQVDFIPYFNTGNVLIAKQGGSYQPKTPIDMCGHKFATNQGAYVEEVARGSLSDECRAKGLQPIKVSSFPSDALAFQEVVAGRADVTFADVAVTKARLGKEPKLGLAITSAPGDLFYPTPSGLAVKKGNAEVQTALTKAIADLEADGRLDALRKKYGLAPPDMAQVNKAISGS